MYTYIIGWYKIWFTYVSANTNEMEMRRRELKCCFFCWTKGKITNHKIVHIFQKSKIGFMEFKCVLLMLSFTILFSFLLSKQTNEKKSGKKNTKVGQQNIPIYNSLIFIYVFYWRTLLFIFILFLLYYTMTDHHPRCLGWSRLWPMPHTSDLFAFCTHKYNTHIYKIFIRKSIHHQLIATCCA